MAEPTDRIALFPGTFDPIHLGHVDVIHRVSALFDRLVVAVGNNPEKKTLLAAETRLKVVQTTVTGLANVEAELYSGLTVDFARERGATVIVRGVRSPSDLESEIRMAVTNRAASGVETLFMVPSPACAFFSSSLIKQISQGGGNVSGMVPPEAMTYLAGG